jgi:hypothetical protein
VTKATDLLDELRALLRDNDRFGVMIRSENVIRRQWPDLTPADREELDELIPYEVDDAAEGPDSGKWLVVRGSLDAVMRETSD